MRKLYSIVLIGVLGLMVAGVSSYLVSEMKGPTFAWEMAGVMFIIATLVGGVAGSVSAAVCALPRLAGAPLKRVGVGMCIGLVLSLPIGLFVVSNSSATHPRAPEGLVFWAVAVVVIGGSLAGIVGGLLADPITIKWHFSVRTLLLVMALVAILLGLVVLLR